MQLKIFVKRSFIMGTSARAISSKITIETHELDDMMK